MNRSSMCSFRKISLLLLIIATALLRAHSQELSGNATATTTATEAPTANATESETEPPFRCLGICGEDSGVLEEPDEVVEYQWNHRVPVCSGLSCDNDSCARLETKLSLILEIDEFECARHRLRLQRDAGCTCSEAASFDSEDTGGSASASSTGGGGGGTGAAKSSPKRDQTRGWVIFGIITALLVAIFIGFALGVRHDDRVAASKAANEGKESAGEP
eukprot:CAMPEP_0197175844 /NCGR_PEP_ID=MMETSP1423-20130617/1959_1 /TAXON_ID=476441 /ORGANISM="Pseudo-nitzschia heimii, Strain UNC1101" /LENGTH=217 /DNA_ID=CAMNT_0042625093 /DNA_START=45 /DNA_END=698 /DNA_ORIENTATION=-